MIWKERIETVRILVAFSESFSKKESNLFNILTLWEISKKFLQWVSKMQMINDTFCTQFDVKTSLLYVIMRFSLRNSHTFCTSNFHNKFTIIPPAIYIIHSTLATTSAYTGILTTIQQTYLAWIDTKCLTEILSAWLKNYEKPTE